jgi:glutamine phosphoribosylpyrophosphate amidotransferase
MCGIFGYYTFGTPKELQAILDVLFTGLKRLEYRGYDSAGICVDSAECPGRVSTDGSRRTSYDSSSPFGCANGTAGAQLEAALKDEEAHSGPEPVIIKCPGKIENLEKMTEQYVKDHVSAGLRMGVACSCPTSLQLLARVLLVCIPSCKRQQRLQFVSCYQRDLL